MEVIDRDFWLGFAKSRVENSIKSREKAAATLDTFLFWIWGIYAGLFTSSVLLGLASGNMAQMLWATQPVLIILLARFICDMAAMPGTKKESTLRADPHDVASIIDCYQLIVDDKRKKLLWAKIATFVSILSLSAALIGYSYCDPNKDLKQKLQRATLVKEIWKADTVIGR